MPLYAFSCAACGAFDLWREAGAAGYPAVCPTCGHEARRRFTPPGLARTPARLRRAREAEERSGHEPAVVSQPSGRPLPGHAHGAHPPWMLGH